MKYHIIEPDGTEVIGTCPDTGLPLEQMQQLVGGYIELSEVLYHAQVCQMFVNEDGKLRRLPLNQRATDIYHEGFGAIRKSDYIVGTAIIYEGKLKNADDD